MDAGRCRVSGDNSNERTGEIQTFLSAFNQIRGLFIKFASSSEIFNQLFLALSKVNDKIAFAPTLDRVLIMIIRAATQFDAISNRILAKEEDFLKRFVLRKL